MVAKDDALQLIHEKSNFGKKSDPVSLVRNGDGVPMPDERASTDAGMCAESCAEWVAKADADAVLAVLKIAAENGIAITTATSGARPAWRALCDLPELGKQYRTGKGKNRVYAALVRLERERQIVRVSFRNAQRKFSEKWEVAP